MFLYNVHAPNKTFALTHKDGEKYEQLVGRILKKGDVEKESGKTGLVYEYEGGRWSLDDDDDLEILYSRIPPASSSSVTLHLTTPHHAHFASSTPNGPPAYSTASSILANSKGKSKSKSGSVKSASASTSTSSPKKTKVNGTLPPILTSTSTATGKDNAKSSPNATLAPPVGSGGTAAASTNGGLKAESVKSKAHSVFSTKSRKSKWGDNDAEPLGDTIKREWVDFHNNIGVRTVVGKVGDVPNVRMLLKGSGYRHVYVSREFATKHGIVPKKFAMGAAGYTGLKTLGSVSITVGTKTASHPAYINEENHFDVVLGRSWLEKMAVKIDPLDQTILTYMDNGEAIPVDVVVLKDADGNVITIT